MSDWGQGGGFGQPPGGGGFPPQQPQGGGWQQPQGEGAGHAERSLASIPFDEAELSNLGTMATFMLVAGVINLVSAVLGIIGGVVEAAMGPSLSTGHTVGNLCGAVLGALAAGVLGAWLIVGANAFRKVIQSDEADQVHLVTGLKQLRNVFLLKSVLILLVLVGICLMAAIAPALAGAGGPGSF